MGGMFGGGGTTQATTTPQLPPELARLYGLQGRQFEQTFPLQQALTEAEAGQIGFTKRLPTPGPTMGGPSMGVLPQGLLAGPTQPDAPFVPGIMSTPNYWNSIEQPYSSSGVFGAPSRSNLITRDRQDMQAIPTGVSSDNIPSWDYTGQSPLISALQSSFTLRPEELALPGRIRDINAPLLASLQGGTSDYGDFTSRLSDAILRGADEPLNTDAMLFGLNQQLERNVLPEVRSASIRMGHSPDVTSSGYSRLLGDVSRQYGGAVSETLAKSELMRREQATRARTLAQLVRTGGQENLRAAIPMLQALGLSGPQAEAVLAASLRQAEGQRAMVPLDLIRRNAITPPQFPNIPAGQTSTGRNLPTTGAQVVAGLNQALMFALLGSAGGEKSAFSGLASLFGLGGAGGSGALEMALAPEFLGSAGIAELAPALLI